MNSRERMSLDGYYFQTRANVFELLPSSFKPRRILDVGCGAGAASAYLKAKFPQAYAVGIEVYPPAAQIARTQLDQVIEASAESAELPPAPNSFDVILCLDVLEHLNDPWAALTRFAGCLSADGFILISLPNIQNWRVILNLMRGKWQYQDFGIMDRTHLRFFTCASAKEMVQSAALRPVRVKHSMGLKLKIVNALTLGFFRRFFAYQIFILAEKVKC